MTKGFVLLFVLGFLLASSLIIIKPAFIAGVFLAKAQIQSIETSAFLSVEPNPVEIGQTVTANMSIEPPPPTPTDRFNYLILKITRPDNATETIGPFFSYPNGSLYTVYMPVKYGIYALQLKYPGESFAGGTIVYESATSAITTLNVTQEIQPTPTPSPTPQPTPTPTTSPTASPSPETTATPSPEPTPEMPEFPSWITLALFITATLFGGLFYKRKRKR